MAIKLRQTAEPLSFAARTDTPPHPGHQTQAQSLLARSHAANVLEHEMRRYCNGLLRGRSFLIAGHRGAGKTTTVDWTVRRLQEEALANKVRFRPVPVYIQGPQVLPKPRDRSERTGPAGPLVSQSEGGVAMTVAIGAPPAEAADKPAEAESLEQCVLIQVAQGLHEAVAREYVSRFHLHARRALAQHQRNAHEIVELAARFQIELNEAPSSARLQEFWREAGAERSGLLFDPGHPRGDQQGLRELVALNGIGHVYQRIAGKLKQTETLSDGRADRLEQQMGVSVPWAELVKPLSALAAGTVVGGAAAASGDPLSALLLGVLSALGAGLLFKMNSSSTRQQERQVDLTFMPDLSTQTLHRVMPELFERMLAAGLAPVFVIDELDKVDDLYQRIHQLLDNLKKLFAERAFTCLLVDRGFYEQLHLREELERQLAQEAPP